MNLKTAMSLYAGQSGGSSLVDSPDTVTDTPKVRDMARRRLSKSNPDIDSGGVGSGRHSEGGRKKPITPPKTWSVPKKRTKSTAPKKSRDKSGDYMTLPRWNANADQQTDSAAFVGKKYRIQDTKYGHLTSEHDDSDSANTAMLARPYSRILKHNEPRHDPKARKIAQKKAAKHNPDID